MFCLMGWIDFGEALRVKAVDQLSVLSEGVLSGSHSLSIRNVLAIWAISHEDRISLLFLRWLWTVYIAADYAGFCLDRLILFEYIRKRILINGLYVTKGCRHFRSVTLTRECRFSFSRNVHGADIYARNRPRERFCARPSSAISFQRLLGFKFMGEETRLFRKFG